MNESNVPTLNTRNSKSSWITRRSLDQMLRYGLFLSTQKARSNNLPKTWILHFPSVKSTDICSGPLRKTWRNTLRKELKFHLGDVIYLDTKVYIAYRYCVCVCVWEWVCVRTHMLSCLVVFDSDSMDWSPPGSSIHEILQLRILERAIISYPGGFPNPGIEPTSPALAGSFFTTVPPGKSNINITWSHKSG